MIAKALAKALAGHYEHERQTTRDNGVWREVCRLKAAWFDAKADGAILPTGHVEQQAAHELEHALETGESILGEVA